MIIRKVFVVFTVLSYASLCLYDLTNGRPRTGIAAGLLAAANAVIYWG